MERPKIITQKQIYDNQVKKCLCRRILKSTITYVDKCLSRQMFMSNRIINVWCIMSTKFLKPFFQNVKNELSVDFTIFRLKHLTRYHQLQKRVSNVMYVPWNKFQLHFKEGYLILAQLGSGANAINISGLLNPKKDRKF